MTPADFDLLTQIIHNVGRQASLSPDDALDFAQTVHLKLLERHYRPVRQFSGRSSLKTYLTVVVRRMLLDWRRTQFGKWRSSAAARRLGSTAVALERLIYRSGHTLNEAVQILRARTGAADTAEIERLAEQIPVRLSARTVSLDDLPCDVVAEFEDPLERLDERASSAAVRQRLRAALQALPVTERELLDLRYRQMLRVPAIAAVLNADSKALYRRCDKALRALRAQLQADGVCASR